jgi:ADP-ribose pyrophosphatase
MSRYGTGSMHGKEDNPWISISSRTVYENPWINVREDQVIRPDGAPGIYGVVHMKNKAIGIVPIDADGHIYLVGQYRYTLNCYSWEIPEGGGPEDEDPLQAAQRELLEETGLIAATWGELGRAHLSNSVTDEEAVYYLATDLVQHEAQPEGTEQLQIQRVPFEEALRMVLAGEITDGLSVIGILRYALTHTYDLTTNEHR